MHDTTNTSSVLVAGAMAEADACCDGSHTDRMPHLCCHTSRGGDCFRGNCWRPQGPRRV